MAVLAHCRKEMNGRAAFVAAAVAALASLTAAEPARAQGFFDFLFGGPQRPPPQPNYPPPPSPPIGRIAPAPLSQERVNENGGSTGHAVAFCVRLCDGQHFPMERMANATPADTCKAICPTSATKVYFGAEVASAAAADGARYADLNTAFLYRKRLIANCTCNGKDPFGLTSFDVKRDPTLRPGDIVSTKEGLLTYSGRNGAAAFTPTTPAALGPELNSVSSRQRSPQQQQQQQQQQPVEVQEVEDDPGTFAPAATAPPPPALSAPPPPPPPAAPNPARR